jgi:hypothetical protein
MNDKRIPSERPAQAARSNPLAPVAPSRPTGLDFFLILVGCTLSLLLADLSGFRAQPTGTTPPWAAALLRRSLPSMLFLPLGILLLWPLFYLTQRIAGRAQPITVGEWLWGVAWLGAVLLTAWVAWQAWGTPPEFLSPETFKGRVFVGYAVATLAFAAVALLTGLVDLIGRWGRPWTHHLALALLLWPVLPLLALLAWKIEIQ